MSRLSESGVLTERDMQNMQGGGGGALEDWNLSLSVTCVCNA